MLYLVPRASQKCLKRAIIHFQRSQLAKSEVEEYTEDLLMWWWLFDAAMMGEI